MLEKNRLDCKKICLFVIEIMFVGMYVDMFFVCVLMKGSVVKELLFFVLFNFVVCFNK